MEVKTNRTEICDQTHDLVITPGLVFGETGNRLGRGGSYYDRFFKNEQFKAVKCGLAFSEQLVDDVPVCEWDVPVDMLVTDQNVYYFNSNSIWRIAERDFDEDALPIEDVYQPAYAFLAEGVFCRRGLLQVNACHGGERGQPGKNVGKLALQAVAVGAAQRPRQLAHLLGEPDKSALDAARAVFGEVDLLDQPLELGDGHRSRPPVEPALTGWPS